MDGNRLTRTRFNDKRKDVAHEAGDAGVREGGCGWAEWDAGEG